jgi:UDP-N-acetylmuramoyl-L-alanyl-D-glutamate--2,6-diaminopimelate ligase
VLTTSLSRRDADAHALIEHADMTGVQARFAGPWGTLPVHLPLTGRHNVCNALQAMTICHALGVSASAMVDALERCNAPPGRLERVTDRDWPFSVFVDYAHTDDALRNVLSAVKPLVSNGARLIVVFGCGGDRDRTKRPRMAAAAWEFADRVIITSDNPRTEDPLAIIEQITRGVPGNRSQRTIVEPDRERAIHRAIESARTGDMIIIAGKGHEDYQIIGKTKRPFDDRLVARRAISSMAELAAP